jgi:hypothetical protein
MTLGMLAIAVASFLFVPAIGERRIDPALAVFGANASDVAQHLLTVAACYQFGAMTFRGHTKERLYLKCWRVFAVAVAVGMIVTYRAGDYWRIAAEEFELDGTANLAHNWLIVVALLATFTLVTVSAIQDVRDGRAESPRLQLSILASLILGLVGVGCSAVTGVLLIVDPTYIRESYNQFAGVWTIPALIALTVAGVPGLVAAWHRRDDPRG